MDMSEDDVNEFLKDPVAGRFLAYVTIWLRNHGTFNIGLLELDTDDGFMIVEKTSPMYTELPKVPKRAQGLDWSVKY